MNATANYSTMSAARTLHAYLADIRFEFVKMTRTPAFAVPTLFFPAMFYLLFGVLMGRHADAHTQLGIFARLGVFGTMAPGLFGFGVSLAFEREYGLLTFKQALPTPPGSYLLARMVMAMLFASVISTLLIVLALTAAHAPLTIPQALKVFVIEVLGVLPFCAIGLFVGASVSGQAAPAIVNIIYLPMAFLSGLWVPFEVLPKFFLDIAPLWPSYHLAQIALHALDQNSYGSLAGHVLTLSGITLLFFTLAMRKLAGGGLHLFGRRSGGLAFPLRKALGMGVIGVSIALLITGVLGGHAIVPAATTTAAAEAGTGSPVTGSSPAASAGVAAPDTVVISDFDQGNDRAAYGLGWTAADDKQRGGNSSASQKVVEGGAAHSKGALEVSGTVGDGIQYPFAGTAFLPNGVPDPDPAKQAYTDYSHRKTLSFYARGDGQNYLVMFIGRQLDQAPPMFPFTAGSDWQKVTVPLDGMDPEVARHVKVIVIGSMQPGPIRFQIDDVRIE